MSDLEGKSMHVHVAVHYRHNPICFQLQTRSLNRAHITCSGVYSCLLYTSSEPTRRTPISYAVEMVSETELECPLPPSPLSNTSRSAVNTWNISVSNDGLTYSNHLQLTVYDSRCLDCQCAGQCQLKVCDHTVCACGGA